MIRYALACDGDHAFESWFRDSAAFDALAQAGQLACPACGSAQVRKALMAPSVVTARGRSAAPSLPDAVAPPAPSREDARPAAALLGERERGLRAALRALHREITDKAENVGRAFATEARRIHEGEGPARSIYGEASRDDVKALLDDGIPLMPMPVLPDDHH